MFARCDNFFFHEIRALQLMPFQILLKWMKRAQK